MIVTNWYTKFFKNILDFFIALVAILLLSPIFIMVTILLWLAHCGNPFFVQNRAGEHGKIFKMLKFKTMNDKRGENGQLLPDANRLFALGRLIRKTSLDEIPQLLNVIKGDMSLVGPRPLLVEYLPLYNEEQRKRHSVRPGITGWAQVNGRNAISWEQKFEYDVWYVDHRSFALDMKIIFYTIKKVFKREGISQDGQATMRPFQGSKEK